MNEQRRKELEVLLNELADRRKKPMRPNDLSDRRRKPMRISEIRRNVELKAMEASSNRRIVDLNRPVRMENTSVLSDQERCEIRQEAYAMGARGDRYSAELNRRGVKFLPKQVMRPIFINEGLGVGPMRLMTMMEGYFALVEYKS